MSYFLLGMNYFMGILWMTAIPDHFRYYGVIPMIAGTIVFLNQRHSGKDKFKPDYISSKPSTEDKE